MVVEARMTLNTVYLDIVKEALRRDRCEVSPVVYYPVDLSFERIVEIEKFSYLLIDKKRKSIFESYYKTHISSLRRGKKIFYPNSSCLESIQIQDRVLEVVFRRARIFPTLYIDFIVLNDLRDLLDIDSAMIKVKKASNRGAEPYLYKVAEALKINSNLSSISHKCIETIQRRLKQYEKIVKLESRAKVGKILKLASFYYCHGEEKISRAEARRLYYYLRYMNNLDSKTRRGGEDGEKIIRKIFNQ